MNFLNALKLTIGLLFVRSLLKKVFPIIDDTIIGNLIFSAAVFFAFIYITIKQYQINTKEIFPTSSEINKNVFGITTSIISMYLLAWVAIEVEVLVKDGFLIYFQNNEEIFAWGSRQKFFLTALVVSPVFEELYFRGLLLSLLVKKYSINRALLYSTILFGASHIRLDNTFISTLFYSLGSGLFYGWIFIKTKDIRYAIYSHFIWNLMNYIFPFMMFLSAYSIKSFDSFIILVIILVAISIVLGFISYKYLLPLRFSNKVYSENEQ